MAERIFDKNLLVMLAGIVSLPAVLKREKEELEEAMEKVTREGGRKEVIIGGETYIVIDPKRIGCEVKPL